MAATANRIVRFLIVVVSEQENGDNKTYSTHSWGIFQTALATLKRIGGGILL